MRRNGCATARRAVTYCSRSARPSIPPTRAISVRSWTRCARTRRCDGAGDPAFPETGRTVYQGNLFVGAVPLNESPLKDHPLNPMHGSICAGAGAPEPDPDRSGGSRRHRARTGCGPGASGRACRRRHWGRYRRCRFERDLETIGKAALDHWRIRWRFGAWAWACPRAGHVRPRQIACDQRDCRRSGGGTGGLSGRQLFAGDASADRRGRAGDAGAASRSRPGHRGDEAARAGLGPGKAGARPDPDRQQFGAGRGRRLAGASRPRCRGPCDRAGDGRHAEGLVRSGVRRLVVAGGETSGAVVDRLQIPGFLVGAEIAAGVPVLRAVGANGGDMLLALKSGNFGAPEFFSDALKLMR